MGKLIMVRHGRTVLNSLDDSERLRGWLEVPLDQQGLQEAVETAERIARHPVQRIYCSDLPRARQTAEAVVKATKAPIVHTSDLRPWNLGTLAGQRVVDILPVLKESSWTVLWPRRAESRSFNSMNDIRESCGN